MTSNHDVSYPPPPHTHTKFVALIAYTVEYVMLGIIMYFNMVLWKCPTQLVYFTWLEQGIQVLKTCELWWNYHYFDHLLGEGAETSITDPTKNTFRIQYRYLGLQTIFYNQTVPLSVDIDASSTRRSRGLLASTEGKITAYRTKKSWYYYYYHFSTMTTNL